MLWVVGGFGGIFGFVQMHVLELLVAPSNLLKMFGMYILPILWLSAGLVLLMCIASLASLGILINDFKRWYVCFGVVMGRTMLVDATGSWSVVFLNPIPQTSTWFSNIWRIASLLRTNPMIYYVLAQMGGFCP